MEVRLRVHSRARALAAAALLVIALSSPAAAAPPDDTIALARGRAAAALGVPGAQLTALGDVAETALGGRRYATALFRAPDGRESFVAVDVAGRKALDAAAWDALVAREAGRPDRDKFSPEARKDLGRGQATLGFVLAPVHFAAAVERVKARHRDVEWLDDRPIGTDARAVEAARLAVLEAKAREIERARRPFQSAASNGAAEPPVALDLAPIVFVTGKRPHLEALARRSDVTEVRAARSFVPSMSSAGPTVQAPAARSLGWTGSGVRVGIVEYGGIALSTELPSSARAAALRVTTNTSGQLVCGTGPVAASGHMTLVTAVAVGRGVRYSPGVAPAASFIEASANFDERAFAADPRILKAVDCAIRFGSNVLNLSIIQNNQAGNGATSDAYIDYVVHEHHVFIAIAAANHDTNQVARDQCNGVGIVPSPGSAWNGMTVGGTWDKNTTRWSDDTTWWHLTRNEPAYCWAEPPAEPGDARNDRVKPEMSAPARSVGSAGRVGSGTSFAAPQVAGAAATLMGQKPDLRTQPEAVKALLLAGSVAHRTYTPTGTAPHVGYEGVGTLSVKWANLAAAGRTGTAADLGGYGTRVVTATKPAGQTCYSRPAPVDIPIRGRAGRDMRFAIAWNRHEDTRGITQRWTDFNVQLWKDGVMVKSSTRWASNIEWVDVDEARDGTYVVRILPVRWGCYVPQDTFGWGWVSLAVP